MNVCENWESDFESHSESDFSGFDSVSESEIVNLNEKLDELEDISIVSIVSQTYSDYDTETAGFSDVSGLIEVTINSQRNDC